ncbi:MAG TPA: ATP-binding protein [Bacteroidota bacterium]|nr:ATP-binding protein [Bacteroidota bacterium]
MKLQEILHKNQILHGEPDDTFPAGAPVRERSQGLIWAGNLESILNITRMINTSLVLSDVLSLVMDQAIRITRADRGFIVLADADNHLQRIMSLDKDGKEVEPRNFRVSTSVLDDVFRTGESICIEDALHDERFEPSQSIIDLELQTIMCAPLMTPDATIGVIYVDSKSLHAINKGEILRLFEILAGQAAIAIQNARLYSNLKKTYDELKEANDHIIRSERMALRGEMAAEVSHELNNILTIAHLQAQSLKRYIQRRDTENSEKYSGDILESINRIQTFAENLLVRSTPKSELAPLQINELIGKFHLFIRLLKKFRSGKIVLELQNGIPEINADRDQIQQVLLNLVNNAIEAAPQATITITTACDQSKREVRLSVADNGPGLDPNVKEKLFTEKITTKPNGHGYGLPVCKKIVDNHGGTIIAESAEGRGTKFIITFPLQMSQPDR